MSTAIEKYLQHYAETEARNLQPLLSDSTQAPPFKHVVVIPAYRETPAFIEQFFSSPLAASAVLVILVINQPQRDRDSATNSALLRYLADNSRRLGQYDNLQLLQRPGHGAHVLLVDRYSEALRPPDNQAVGLARKVGADIAVAAIACKLVDSAWIHNTDADAHLPADYLTALRHQRGAAAIYPFRHRCDDSAVGQATQLYERALNYYVEGLAWAGSPYAFHTVGSVIAVQVEHYCQVRGFPRRAGGEDFYLLNKLAKLGNILQLTSAPIELAARQSARVPFGTGPAVQRIVERQRQQLPYCYYNPDTLLTLKRLLAAVPHLWPCRSRPQQWLQQLPEPARAALRDLHVQPLFDHIGRQAKSARQCELHFHYWFDALRTLKFIHYLQRHHFAAMPLQDALAGLRQLQAAQ